MRRGSRTPHAVPAQEGPGGRRCCLPNTCDVPPASPSALISPALPLPNQPRQQEQGFSRWLLWVTSAPQIFPSEIATLIENRGSALSLQGLLRQACRPRRQGATRAPSLASCNSTRLARGPQKPPHSIPCS